MKNKTLEFFSRALPILQADESLPKVTKYQQGYENEYYNLWVVNNVLAIAIGARISISQYFNIKTYVYLLNIENFLFTKWQHNKLKFL